MTAAEGRDRALGGRVGLVVTSPASAAAVSGVVERMRGTGRRLLELLLQEQLLLMMFLLMLPRVSCWIVRMWRVRSEKRLRELVTISAYRCKEFYFC